MLAADGCAKAKEIAAWKEEVAEKWDSIEEMCIRDSL